MLQENRRQGRAGWARCGLLLGDALERGLRVYFYLLAVLSLLRVLFLWGMSAYLGPQTGPDDVALALWTGLRLSLRTAGLLTVAAWLPAELWGLVRQRGRRLLLQGLTALELALLSIGFVARFPYYRQFHAGYNQALFNTLHDDVGALLVTMVQEFNLPWRLAGALLLAAVLWWPLHRWLEQEGLLRRLLGCLTVPGQALVCLGGTGLCCLVCLWTMYGGSLGWQTALEWENAGVTKDNLLNEAILDDVQAVWRGYTLTQRNLACGGLEYTPEEIRRLAAGLAAAEGRPGLTGKDLDVYLTHRARGARLPQPSQVFLIISESLANWPLLEEYEGLHIADGLRGLVAAPDTAYTGALLPNGAFTVSAVMGLVTGFADANLYLTTMPEAFRAPYPTASAPIMQRLGYTPRFWYAGPATWESVQDFTMAQGFASFTGRGAFGAAPGSVWGVEDEYFYQGVLAQLDPQEKGFHVLLNATNHSPYSLDLDKAGFPKERVRAALPEAERSNEELLRQLGHYWYADQQLTKLVRSLRQRFPGCLIAIVGDHADRYNIERSPGLYRRLAVPFLLIGDGVTKAMLPQGAAGSHIDVLPTLVELLAPEGFAYEALGSSLSLGNGRGVNYGYVITPQSIGKAELPFQLEDFQGRPAALQQEAGALEDYINAIWAISWWRAKKGPILQ